MSEKPVEERLKVLLETTFSPQWMTLDNESHMHSVPENSETHFKVVLVSAAFDGISRVKRHQRVYEALTELLPAPIHALALHTYSPEEWQGQQVVPNSPQCLGGSKVDPKNPLGSAG